MLPDARYLVQGSVLRLQNRIRVTAMLISMEDDLQMWADVFEQRLNAGDPDMQGIADRIVAAVSRQVQGEDTGTRLVFEQDNSRNASGVAAGHSHRQRPLLRASAASRRRAMSRAFRSRVILPALWCLLMPWTAAQASEPAIERLFKPAEVSHVSVSPDGQHIAMVRSQADQDTLILFKRPLAEGSIVSGVESTPGERFANVRWANSTQVLIEGASIRRNTAVQLNGALYLLGTDGTRRRLMKQNPEATPLTSAVVSVLPEDPAHILLAAHSLCAADECTPGEANRRSLARASLQTGAVVQLAKPPPLNAYFVSNPQGTQVFAAGRTTTGTVQIYALTGSTWELKQQFDPAASSRYRALLHRCCRPYLWSGQQARHGGSGDVAAGYRCQ